MEMYLVGGAVRDKLMGKAPKDFDFSVVLDETTDLFFHDSNGKANYFASMQANLIREHGVTFFPGKAQKPEHFTAKGKFPKGHQYSNLVAEFVLARKEGTYTDGRRPDSVEVGTLHDDLARRDFTINAIAQDMDGNLIDPFDGEGAISLGLIETVGEAKGKFMEDALRVLRALRFSVTLGFQVNNDVRDAMRDNDVLRALNLNISDERKMDELNKMFRSDAVQSILALNMHPGIMASTFAGDVNLQATLKQKGFN